MNSAARWNLDLFTGGAIDFVGPGSERSAKYSPDDL